MSNRLLRLVWGLKPCGNSSQRLVLAALADHADESGRCWPGVELLQAETDLNRRTISRCLKSLEARKWITINRKSVGNLHRGSAYVLDKDRLLAEQRTQDMVSPVQYATRDTMSGVQATNTTITPDTVSPALEPPLSPNGTPISPQSGARTSRARKSEHADDVPPFELPPWIDKQTWKDYDRMRDGKGKMAAMDDGIRWSVVKRLEKFRAEGMDVNDILETSTVSKWTGVFRQTGQRNGGKATASRINPREGMYEPDSDHLAMEKPLNVRPF